MPQVLDACASHLHQHLTGGLDAFRSHVMQHIFSVPPELQDVQVSGACHISMSGGRSARLSSWRCRQRRHSPAAQQRA
jgi:hypothetical protein